MNPVECRQKQSRIELPGVSYSSTVILTVMDFQYGDKSLKISVMLGQDGPKCCNAIFI